VEVVVTLAAPPLAEAIHDSRVLAARVRLGRLDLRSPTSLDYLRALAAAQARVAARIVADVPGARVTWRYQVVADGMAVLLPRDQLDRLARVPGVAEVWPSVAYRPLDDRSPHLIGADQLWGAPAFTTAGNGVKIGIVDDGVDQAHPFFDPAGYTFPPGFPKGDVAYTTAKVIVARAFAPPTSTWKYARRPFDPAESDHGTHVAGIAAGDYSPGVLAGRGPLSGVAPKAYLGNYKVLSVPTQSFGLNGNSPEITAGIEAAVKDGMDVINLSLGEPEFAPSRDIVVAAIDAAADAGVVPTLAAGNDFDEFGDGTVISPASASKGIAVAAATKSLVVADFSSGGPTPMSLQAKPDVTAPGVDITSSLPPREGTWGSLSGTSMAAPHVAGAAALLRQRHPGWTVAQIKSALVLTGTPVRLGGAEAPATREGGGLIDLPAANAPAIFASPTSLSFGLLRVGAGAARSVALTDAGGGAGTWTVSVAAQTTPAGVELSAPATVDVPGTLTLTASAAPDAAEGDATGFVVLRLGSIVRRIPYWFRVEAPLLASEPHGTLRATGTYAGRTSGRPSRVRAYRYPDRIDGQAHDLGGPEQVFRIRLARPVANLGVAVLDERPGVRVSPRVVLDDDENRLAGYAGLPVAINPYLASFGASRPVAGAVQASAGVYDVVFDTPTGARPGAFTFRFWVNDVTPPTVRLLARVVRRGARLELAVRDAGSGVDPRSLQATVDGRAVAVAYARGRARVALGATAPGAHRLVFRASDYQELKNDENVPRILPNTRELRATFRVR
jgi:subtilisin family serine protease